MKDNAIIVALAIACAFSVLACGAPPPDSDAEQQSQAASSLHIAHDESVSLSQSSTRFFRIQYIGATGGHAGSATWSTGVPKFGASMGAWPPSLTAYAYDIGLGTADIAAIGNDYSDFGFGPGASQSSNSSPFYFSWGTSYGSNPVGNSMNLWSYPGNFCFLNGVNGLSHADEIAHVYPYGTWWKMGAYGYAELQTVAKCLYFDRSYTLSGPHAVSSGGTTFGPASSNSFCAITKVQGNLDDGWLAVGNAWGAWYIQSSGVSGEMMCAVF
jgi:hypothetical protein